MFTKFTSNNMKFHLFIFLFFIICISSNAQVNIERYRKSQDNLGFGGEFGAGITVKTGNTDFQLISGKGRINYNGGTYYIFLVIGGDFGWKSGEQFSNEALIHLRHVTTLTTVTQVELFGQIDYNNSRKLSFRKLAGSGLRFKVYRDSTLRLTFGSGFILEDEIYDLPPGTIHKTHTTFFKSTNYFTTEINLSETTEFNSTIYYQPAVNAINDFKMLSENSFVTRISKYFDLTAFFNLRFDSRPPDKIKKLDINSIFGFKVKF